MRGIFVKLDFVGSHVSSSRKEWSAEHGGHEIRVKIDKRWNAELYIDGELRDTTPPDKRYAVARGEIWLSTELSDTGDIVDIRFKSGLFTVKTKILVDKKQIGGDIFENSPGEEKVDSSSSEVWNPGFLTRFVAFLFFEIGIWFLIGMIYVVFFWDFGETW